MSTARPGTLWRADWIHAAASLRGRRSGPGGRLRECGRPPPRPIAFDRGAPLGERPVEGGGKRR